MRPLKDLLCTRKAALQIVSNFDDQFDKDMSDTVLESTTSLRNQIHHEVEDNIKKAQEKQQHDYELRRLKSNNTKAGDNVFLTNKKSNDRKCGKFTFKWLGPYQVDHFTDHGLVSLKNQKGNIFKKCSTSFFLNIILLVILITFTVATSS